MIYVHDGRVKREREWEKREIKKAGDRLKKREESERQTGN